MRESTPQPTPATEAALAALLEEQRRSLPWLTVAESVVAPARVRALVHVVARLDEPGHRI